jgi:hypothetical protein
MRQLDQGVGKSPITFSIVAFAGARGERLEGGAQDSAAFRIQDTTNPEQSALARAQGQ